MTTKIRQKKWKEVWIEATSFACTYDRLRERERE